MMIGKRVRFRSETKFRQRIEETLWISNSCHSVDPLRCQRRRVIAQISNRRSLQRHRKTIAALKRTGYTVTDNEIHLIQSLRRLAQWPDRQAVAVTQSSLAINNSDLQVPPQRIVLKPIIADNQIALRLLGQQIAHRPGAIRIDHQRAAATTRQHHRLVAYLSCIAVLIYQQRIMFGLAAIAATDHSGLIALLLQPFKQPEGKRRFAGTTDADITHHDYRNRCVINRLSTLLILPTAFACCAFKQPFQRRQQLQATGFAIPSLIEPGRQVNATRTKRFEQDCG